MSAQSKVHSMGGDGGGGSRYGGNNTHGGEDGEVGKGVEGGAGKGSGDKNNGIRRRVHDGKADKARISATTLQYSCAVDSVPHACHDVSYSDADGATQRPYWDVAVGFRLWDALVGSQGADERVAAEGAIERQLRSMLAEIRG